MPQSKFAYSVATVIVCFLAAACTCPSLPHQHLSWEKITIPGDIQKIEQAPNGVKYVTDLWNVECGHDNFEIIPTLPNHIVHYQNGEAKVEVIGQPDLNFIATHVVDFQGTRIYGGNGLYAYQKNGEWVEPSVPVIDEKLPTRHTTMYESFLGFTSVHDRLYAAIHTENQIFEWIDGRFEPILLNLPPKFKRNRRQEFLVKAIASDARFVYVAGKYTGDGGLGNVLLIANAQTPLTAQTEWRQVSIPGRGWVTDLAVAPSGDVWIAGYQTQLFGKGGLLVQYQNSKMIVHSKKIPARIHDVNVVADNRVLVVGDRGFAGLWDGTQWQQLEFPQHDTLFGICVLNDQKAYVVGAAGLAYRSQKSLWPNP